MRKSFNFYSNELKFKIAYPFLFKIERIILIRMTLYRVIKSVQHQLDGII